MHRQADKNMRIYLDLEYCYPSMTRQSGRPNENDLRQVIQIAAICYDHGTGKELKSFDTLVSPPFTKVLPEFFVELTGISQTDVSEQSILFPKALDQFIEFCDGIDIYTFDKDWLVLKQNCSYYKIDYPFESSPFVRIKDKLPKWGLPENEYSSGTLYKAAGLNMTGHVHNALHDVRSMAAATHYFERTRIN